MLNAYLQSLIFDINSDIESIQFEALKTISIIPNSELPNKEFLIFHLFNHIIYSKNEGVKYQSRVALCKLVGIKDKFNECSIQNMDSENFEYFINDLSPKRFLSVFLNENFSALKTKFKTDIFDLFVKKLRNSDHVILEIFIIKILAVLPASKKTRLDMITPFLQNENPFILASTIETLGRIKYIESVNKILNFITNDNPLVSLTAFKALQNINSKIIFTCVREIAASQAEHIDEKIKFIFSELTMNTELLTCIYMNLLLEKNNQVIETLLPIFLKFIN
ncbi:HEAT repeat domain-containing protein, partial [bacterium]|nr:HEAT repeat domain-containing protein [bacterium]